MKTFPAADARRKTERVTWNRGTPCQSLAATQALSGLRVVILSDVLRDRSGVDAYYRDLVEHLRPRIDTAELLYPNPADDNHLERLTISMPGDRTQKICVPNPRHLYQTVREINPHVILVATPGPFGLFGLFIAKRLGACLVVGFHTHLERLVNLYWNRIVGGISSRYLEVCNRILFRCARLVVVNSDEMAIQARRLGASAIELVGTPIARPFLETAIKPLSPRLAHVLYAGRLSPEKNVHLIIEAARRVPHLRFSIAGAGPLEGAMRQGAATLGNLSYLGLIPRAQMVSAIDGADLLTLPSQVEAFGTAALEAMARGKLVLVSKHCGILNWPTLAEGMFCIRDHEHLAEAIDRIAHTDAATRARKAARAGAAVRELNSRTLDQWLSILGRLTRLPGYL